MRLSSNFFLTYGLLALMVLSLWRRPSSFTPRLAGLLYAAAILRTGRIESAIPTHFALDAVHFVAFSYPGLAA